MTGSGSPGESSVIPSPTRARPSWLYAGMAKRDGRSGVWPALYICFTGVLSGVDGRLRSASSPSMGHVSLLLVTAGVLGYDDVGDALVDCAGSTLPRRARGNSSAGRPRPMTGAAAHGMR